ncbi:MAG TPA: F0F1 ATP synthase subunit epsilon [Streptosporangiaceae bacterium]|nr:F0F1 ATP synthase subunit epsilon [Streptosporangiaceae bacterium]
MTLRVDVVVPDGEIWSGRARMVIAKTLDGDLGVLTGHPPVIGILAEGSLVQILDPEDTTGAAETAGRVAVLAAVSSGFLSVAEDRVSVLGRQAQLGSQVDAVAVRAELEAALAAIGQVPAGQEPAEVKYAQALLRAAGERS